jgi:hypothetical protein
MNESQIVDLLEELVESLGLQISYESIWLDEDLGARPGGFCLLKGKRLVIINPHASTREKIRILSEALKHFDLSQIYIRPVLRELLDTGSEHKPSEISGNGELKVGEKPIDVEGEA